MQEIVYAMASGWANASLFWIDVRNHVVGWIVFNFVIGATCIQQLCELFVQHLAESSDSYYSLVGFWLQTIATLCLVGALVILQLYFVVFISAALRAHVMYRYWTALYECTGDKRFQVAIAKYRSEQFPNSTIGKILTNYVDLVISTFGKSAYSSMVTPEELVAPVTKVD